jgi:hypothetical protein
LENLQLLGKLLNSAAQMTGGEREALKTVLCFAAQNLSPDGQYPADATRREALRVVICSLANLQAHRHRIPPNGVVFRGRPPFMSDALLTALREEARLARATRPVQQIGHSLGLGGPLADELAVSREMIDFVEAHSQPIRATGVASYLFYDAPGDGMKAHVDTGIFSINANIMLEHTAEVARQSYLYIYPSSGEPEKIVLEPGEMVLSYAGSVVHGRAPLGPGESVRNLTIGFQPV